MPAAASRAGAKVIAIGRGADNDVVLDYPTISTHHAHIVITPQQTWIEDLGSANGTSVGSLDRKIKRAPLSPTDAVFFGSLRVLASRLLEGDLASAGNHTNRCKSPRE